MSAWEGVGERVGWRTFKIVSELVLCVHVCVVSLREKAVRKGNIVGDTRIVAIRCGNSLFTCFKECTKYTLDGTSKLSCLLSCLLFSSVFFCGRAGEIVYSGGSFGTYIGFLIAFIRD